MPTYSDMRLHIKSDPTFPNDKTVANHFGNIAGLTTALQRLALQPDYLDIASFMPIERAEPLVRSKPALQDGSVYLLKSGASYKIGRSDDIERRVKTINVALPDKAVLIHSIRTDDPPGIEAYWHRRFAEKRLNGEWFRLSGEDVKAFRRRAFQ